MKGINTWGILYSKLLKQQLADDSRKESESETKTKNSSKIQFIVFCFSLCFTVLVGDVGHSFHGNFLQSNDQTRKNAALIQGKEMTSSKLSVKGMLFCAKK